MSEGVPLFVTGRTVVRRDVFDGQVWSAKPFRTIGDSDDLLALALWPGVEVLAPTTWIEWARSGDEVVRNRALTNLAAGTWDLDTWAWQDVTKLSLVPADAYFSVDLFFRAGAFWRWYVNFERPCVRTHLGIDTFDLLLDLLVDADLSCRWKDEDEYAQGRRLGLVTDAEHQRVQLAREQVLDLLERRAGPFEERWLAWRPEPSWPLPTLPAGASTI